jgi:DDE superfamily endonuclease
MRTYIRKSLKGTTPVETLREGARLVGVENRSVRSAAKELSICHVTLRRFIEKQARPPSGPAFTYGRNRQIFSKDEESQLADYLKTGSAIYFGLSPSEVRKLAFECATVYKKKVPEKWNNDGMAGVDWFAGFLKRNPTISVRTPEATSLARSASFNKPNVAGYFTKLAEVMDRYKFEPMNIWNMDETGVTTVSKPAKIVAERGTKQVGAITSAERGSLVTLAVAVNVLGSSTPPMFIFPRVKFYDHFIRDGPVGAIGTANKSGWMTEVEFCVFMRHFVKYAKPSTETPVLLLLDNHSSHLSIEAINYAKEHSIVMLSFPPHCSHRLQPLDRSVYGPFKRFLSTAQDAWMRSHPGNPMTIYDLPSLIRDALPRATTPQNIASGFQACGVYPYNKDIFQDHEYAPSIPTDRPHVQHRVTAGSGQLVHSISIAP